MVIRKFLSFELANFFIKYGNRLFFEKGKKNSDFHPHRQRRWKHDPLDPARHDYVVSPPERLHFLGLSLHGDITSACSNSGENFPWSICRLREPCEFVLTWWIMTHIPGCHQVRSNPPLTAVELTSAARVRNVRDPSWRIHRIRQIFLTHACKRRPYRPWEWKWRKRQKRKTKTKTKRRRKG